MMCFFSKKPVFSKAKIAVSVVALCGFIATHLLAQSVRGKYTESERDRLFEQTLAMLPTERVPAEYRAEIAVATAAVRCPTMHLTWVQRNLDIFTPEQRSVLVSLFSRPTDLDLSYPTGHFLIHYTKTGTDAVSSVDRDNNGVPDFVEGVADAFEHSRTVEVNDLGYTPPPDDGQTDGPEYDVYIHDLGRGVYGFTTPEDAIPATQQNDFTSYIEVDNDFNDGHFTTGLPGAQVAAAHELFHAIQFGYRDAIFENDYFYFELCSSWMEDVVYDDINDYYSTVPSYLRRTDEPFNRFERFTLFNYGAAIWNHFLIQKYGDIDLIRRSWENMRANEMVIDAIANALSTVSSNFSTDFPEFAVWCYFTGLRANPTTFFEEGGAYPSVRLAGDFAFDSDMTIVDSLPTLAFKYYKFDIAVEGTFLVSGHAEGNSDIAAAVILERGAAASEIMFLDLETGLNLGFLPSPSELVVVAVNLESLDGSTSSRFETFDSNFQFRVSRVDAVASEPEGITAIYPNPFRLDLHDYVFVEFSPRATPDIEIQILNAGGQVVKSASFGRDRNFLDVGRYRWDGRNDDGEKVPSGVYLVRLRQAGFDQLQKFALIRQ